MTVDIAAVLGELKDGQTPRTQKTLDKLNIILEEYYHDGQKDFSVTTIGRLSARKRGPGYQSLRATKNKHYRLLIEAWATKAGTDMKKPLAEHSRSRETPNDFNLLERINDPALRALFGQVIAERNRYRKEVNLLKQQANVVIDRRPVQQPEPTTISSDRKVQVMSAMTDLLTPLYVEALRYAISDLCMEKNGWYYTDYGQVKNKEYDIEVYPRGYILAIQKVLGET